MSDFRVQGNGLRKGIFDLRKPLSGRLLSVIAESLPGQHEAFHESVLQRKFSDGLKGFARTN